MIPIKMLVREALSSKKGFVRFRETYVLYFSRYLAIIYIPCQKWAW